MAAPITNSNETLDSITEGLLIHEAPLLGGLCFHMPSFLLFSLIPGIFRALTPSLL